MSVRAPKYRFHHPSGQAVVTLSGRDIYLGKHGSPERRAEFDRLLAEWLARGRTVCPPPGVEGSGLTVAELIRAYVRFADGYYVKDGETTDEPANIRYALRPLRILYGHSPAERFGPLALKAVRQSMVDSGLCRAEVNKRVGKVARCFKWGAENELIPASIFHALKTVAGLKRGKTEARESAPVRPVPLPDVDAIENHVSRQVWAMVRIQLLSGMRPGEVCQMRTADLDTSGDVWTYIPGSHKTEHHGRSRVVHLGPKAQEILRPWLRAGAMEYLFSPAEAMEELRGERRAARRTPLTPSQRRRVPKVRPRKTPGARYTTDSYRRAIAVGCARAGVPSWHPHQLRHNAATAIRKDFGLDVARAILGHSTAAVTQIYAEQDGAKAAEAMARVG